MELRFQEYSYRNRYFKCDEFIWSNYIALQYVQQIVDLSSTEGEEGEDVTERKLKSKDSAASGRMAYLTYVVYKVLKILGREIYDGIKHLNELFCDFAKL